MKSLWQRVPGTPEHKHLSVDTDATALLLLICYFLFFCLLNKRVLKGPLLLRWLTIQKYDFGGNVRLTLISNRFNDP